MKIQLYIAVYIGILMGLIIGISSSYILKDYNFCVDDYQYWNIEELKREEIILKIRYDKVTDTILTLSE